MNGETIIDHERRIVRLSITLERIEDAGKAMERIRCVARACWPEIMFNDEELDEQRQECESFATPALAPLDQPKLEPLKRIAAPAGEPDLDVLKAKILDYVERRPSASSDELAAAFGVSKQRAGTILYWLRKNGQLTDGGEDAGIV